MCKKAVENSSYTNVWITVNGSWKVLFFTFRYFHFSNINMSFVENLIKNYLMSQAFRIWQPLAVLLTM